MANEEAFGFVAVVSEDLKQIKATLKEQGGQIQNIRDSLGDLRGGEKDLAALRGIVQVAQGDINTLRERISELRENGLIAAERWTGQITKNENAIENLRAGISRLTWLIASTLITGVIGGVLAYVFHVLGK